MKSLNSTVLTALMLGVLLPLGAVALAAETKATAAPAAVPATTPANNLAGLEAAVGLSPEQKSAVDDLLAKLKAGRKAVKEDASLSLADKHTKIAAVNQEIFAKIKALMTPGQYARWEKLQEAIRSARAK